MPTLYILAAKYTIPSVEITNKKIESAICQTGTPKGILAIIATGEVSGIIDNQKAIGPSGLLIKPKLPYIPSINGKIPIMVNCWVSVSLSTAEHIAAYIEL